VIASNNIGTTSDRGVGAAAQHKTGQVVYLSQISDYYSVDREAVNCIMKKV
jgi:hypothetical protein